MYLPETICPNLQLVKLIRELYQGKSLYHAGTLPAKLQFTSD